MSNDDATPPIPDDAGDITLRDVIVHMQHGFSRLEGRMGSIEGRMDSLEVRIDTLEERLTARIDALEVDLTATIAFVSMWGWAWKGSRCYGDSDQNPLDLVEREFLPRPIVQAGR